jgi:hypothetical protein
LTKNKFSKKILNTNWILPFNDTIKGFSLLFLLLLSAATYSQNKIVGTITDSNGKPLPAVEV